MTDTEAKKAAIIVVISLGDQTNCHFVLIQDTHLCHLLSRISFTLSWLVRHNHQEHKLFLKIFFVMASQGSCFLEKLR